MLWTLHEMFPTAPIYTAMWNRRLVPRFDSCDVRTSWMQRLPRIERAPRAYAALYPLAFASMKVTGFDLVISLTTSFAKGVRTDGALHVCYCNSPSNFVWRSDAYFRRGLTRSLSAPLRTWLRAWDRGAARQPGLWVTNGQPVSDRIRLTYGKDAAIVPPGIDAKWFVEHKSDDFYLAVGRLVPHKRIELAIQACRQLSVPLWVAGDGRAADDLRRLAGPDVHFTGRVSDEELRDLYSRARVVLVPAEEDFGLVPLEAQAAGTPVIAYDAGGARETVIDGETGLRFARQTVEALADAIRDSQSRSWDRERIRANASRFSDGRFRQELSDVIARHYQPMDRATVPTGRERRAV
ncbi:MAG TPA: glycosyltransferase [Candidatus Dormibacteraeota bacterium]|nr:glycosyltransferase [Candidatus Dormibacteraeota bacterium]